MEPYQLPGCLLEEEAEEEGGKLQASKQPYPAYLRHLWVLQSITAIGVFLSVAIFAFASGLGILCTLVDLWVLLTWLFLTVRAANLGAFH